MSIKPKKTIEEQIISSLSYSQCRDKKGQRLINSLLTLGMGY